jgi:hypothetical protein
MNTLVLLSPTIQEICNYPWNLQQEVTISTVLANGLNAAMIITSLWRLRSKCTFAKFIMIISLTS